MYRNQFGETIKAKGVDGLIAELESQKTAANNEDKSCRPFSDDMAFAHNNLQVLSSKIKLTRQPYKPNFATARCTSAATLPSKALTADAFTRFRQQCRLKDTRAVDLSGVGRAGFRLRVPAA